MPGSISVPIEAASSTTARTISGRVAASARATQLPKAWPATMAGRWIAASGALDRRRGVRREIVERQAFRRPLRSPDAARLRADHAEPGGGEARGDAVEILGAAAERGQQHDRRTAALDQHLDPHRPALHDVVLGGGGARGRRGQREAEAQDGAPEGFGRSALGHGTFPLGLRADGSSSLWAGRRSRVRSPQAAAVSGPGTPACASRRRRAALPWCPRCPTGRRSATARSGSPRAAAAPPSG